MASAIPAEKMENNKLTSAAGLAQLRQDILDSQDPDAPVFIVCHGTGCLANGSPLVADALRKVKEIFSDEFDKEHFCKGCKAKIDFSRCTIDT